MAQSLSISNIETWKVLSSLFVFHSFQWFLFASEKWFLFFSWSQLLYLFAFVILDSTYNATLDFRFESEEKLFIDSEWKLNLHTFHLIILYCTYRNCFVRFHCSAFNHLFEKKMVYYPLVKVANFSCRHLQWASFVLIILSYYVCPYPDDVFFQYFIKLSQNDD